MAIAEALFKMSRRLFVEKDGRHRGPADVRRDFLAREECKALLQDR
jgi:hypothetical protein